MTKTLTPAALQAVRTIAEANRDADLKVPAAFLLEILDLVDPLDPAPRSEVGGYYSSCSTCGFAFFDLGNRHDRCVDCEQGES